MDTSIYINRIEQTLMDYPDDESLAIIVYTEGCIHGCKGCHNLELQNGYPDHKKSLEEVVDMIVKFSKRTKANKIVLSGGDPFYNQPGILFLIDNLNNILKYDICVYTGYTVEQVESFYKDFPNLSKPLWLKCGIYREDLKDPNMGKFADRFILASTNQAFYKLEEGKYIQVSEKNELRFN